MSRKTSCCLIIGIIIVLLFLTACGQPEPALVDPDHPQDKPLSLHIQPGSMLDYQGEWADFLLNMRMHRNGEGALGIIFHANPGSGSYIIRVDSNGFYLQKELEGQVMDLAAFEADLEPSHWHPLEIEMLGGEIRAFYLDQMVIEYGDPDPLPPGGLSFETMGDLSVDLEDITVVALGETTAHQQASGESEAPADETEPPQEQVASQPQTPQLDVSQWEWVRLGGPPGGTGYDIRYNFNNPDIWYVTDANSGVHISTDNGATWVDSNTGLEGQSGLTGDAIGVFCLTVDPHDPQILWIGTISHGHVYRSTDGGQTWEARENGIEIEYDQLTFRGFTVDPRSSDIVYAMAETNDESLGGPTPWKGGVGGVVYKTTDAGENWEKIWDGGMPSSLARYMWIDPRDPDVLYVSTGIFDRSAVGEAQSPEDPMGGLGILKSTDGGATWRILGKENGLRNLYVGSLYMHPDQPDVLLAGVGHQGGPESQSYWDKLETDGEPIPFGVYRTEDGGESWTQTIIPDELEEFSSVELCPTDPNIGYAASRFSMYRTTDAGKTWELTAKPWSPPGISAGFPIDMQCDPRDEDRVFVNNYGGGNYLSEDGGKTWVPASNGYTGAQVFEMAIDPDNPARLYVMAFSGLWRSDDAGNNWTGIRYAPDKFDAYRFISVDPNDGSHLFSGQYSFIESNSAGDSWELNWDISTVFGGEATEDSIYGGIPSFVYAPSNASRIYVGFSHELCSLNHEPNCMDDYRYSGPGFMISRDGGASWKTVADASLKGRDIRDVAVDPTDEDIVYLSTDLGVFKTNNAGESWEELPSPAQFASAYALAVDPADPSRLLVGIDRDGVYHSVDSGQTWKNTSAGMEPNSSISAFVFDPVNNGVVYASDILSGVYRSENSGNTWTKINNGIHSRAIADIVISADGNHLYAGSHEDGVYRLDLNGVPPVQ